MARTCRTGNEHGRDHGIDPRGRLTFVDTNVLLDLVTGDSVWMRWSEAALNSASLAGPLVINDVVYAELSARYERLETLETFISGTRLQMALMPREALFLAGRTFATYRKRGGARTGVLPDFFIGAHAAVLDIPLLTRDVGRYQTYFPTVLLIAPG
jgi:predicted nucleic acid-binding protein